MGPNNISYILAKYMTHQKQVYDLYPSILARYKSMTCILASTELACSVGCDSSETATHLFLHCTLATNLWFQVWNWLGISSVLSGDLRHHFIQFTNMAAMPHFSHHYFYIIWFATVWMIWKDRNSRVFRNPASSPFTLIEKIQQLSFLWLKSKQVNFAYSYYDWCKQPLICIGVRL
jgi:hypothetical protein